MKKFTVFILSILFMGVFESINFAEQNYMNIKIDNIIFKVVLEENKTVDALVQKLPITIKMEDLNNNEKYCYLDFTLPTEAKSVKNIKKGDIMLFGNNCLVIFYKSFKTSYSYTRIGHIENSNNIEQVLGKSTVEVLFEK